ncbi:hypothetical protein H4582DRAFT_2080504 [Lactarius indigo]|nr:hypothetical protein H4582DRAFT_2080504 [Lactarius indigo]
MSQFTVHDFFDLKATVDNEEEEEFEDDELGLFFNDNVKEATSDWGSRLTSPVPTDFTKQTLEMRADIARRSTCAAANYDEGVPRHYLVPWEHDPHLWSVCVKSNLIMQVTRRTSLGDKLDITSVFACAGIPGFIFLEAPHLVPLEQHVALLLPCNPLSRPIEEGQWVHCLHRLYCNDLGFVCGHDPTQDVEMTVALVPWIPNRVARTTKWKKMARPEPRSWSLEQLEASWGTSRVQRISSEEYIFGHNKYRSGLIVKNFLPASLANIKNRPNNLRPFLRAPFICNTPSFAPWVHRFAQDTIKPGQWVKVESGDHWGAIRKPLDVRDSIAFLLLNSTGNGPTLQIPLHALAPFYDSGHHIKNRWSESSGIVTSVDEDCKTLTYIERDSQHTIAILTDTVEPYDPPLDFYRAKEGSWVEFNRQKGMDHTKRCRYIRVVEDMHALVIDEHSLKEFEIKTCKLEVCSTQGPSLPKNDPVHPLMGQRVTIIRSPLKGLYSNIREVGATAITVELPALMALSPIQTLKWTDLMLAYVSILAAWQDALLTIL